MADRDRVDSGRLADLLGDRRLGRSVLLHGEVASTSDVAREAGRGGAPDGTVVVARSQSAGRGRRGRVWESPPSGGLYVSVLLRPPRLDASYAAALQLAAGVALAEALAPFLPRRPELLWPNDLLGDGGKLAGVLVESESSGGDPDFLVCGIGVNVNQATGDFSSTVARIATSVRMLRGAPVDVTEIAAALLLSLEDWEDVARDAGPAAVLPRWMEWSPSSRGTRVEVETAGGSVEGVSAGLGVSGGLRVDTGETVEEIVVGELIRVRRRT